VCVCLSVHMALQVILNVDGVKVQEASKLYV
jgi:hypothetical protein